MQKKSSKELNAENQELRARLEEAQETLNAIRRGEVDGLIVSTPKGEQVYTISGADKPYRILIEEMREGAVMLSSDNRVLYCNSGFAKMIKRPIDEIVGSCIQNMVFPNHKTAFKELLAQGRTVKGVKTKEITLRGSDDRPVQTLMTISPFKEGSNETTFLVLTDLTEHMEENIKRYTEKLETEITERKKAEEALKEAEKQLRVIVENSVDGINMLDLKTGKYVFMSSAQVKLTGFSAEEINNISAKEAYERTYPDDREITSAQQKKVASGEDVSEPVEYRWKVKSGEYRWFSDSRKLVRDEKGQAIALVGISRDITERKKAEEKIHQQSIIQSGTKRIFQEALSSSEEALGEVCLLVAEEVTKSKFGFIGEINEEGLEDIAISNPGWDACKVITSKGHRIPVGSFKIHGIYGRVISEGKGFFTNDPLNYPGHVGLPVGHPPLKSFLGVPLLSEGKIIGIVAVGNREGGYGQSELESLEALATAIVEAFLRKRAEKNLEEHKNNLEKLVEERTKQLKDSERLAAIGATAGMVGHDIRNPLQAITGDVYLAKTELDSIPESDEKKGIFESLQEIEKNTEYINKIVADLQDFARPLKPNSEETDLKLIIEELLKKNGLPENVKVSVKVEPDARNVVADHTFINRIMVNLVNNAVQAMPKGGKLTIQSFKEANDVIISVKDTGVGIPEAVKGKLFTPMFTTKAKGQGFGLAVIKRMTESLGGNVTFESQESKGTTFIVRLPQFPQQKN